MIHRSIVGSDMLTRSSWTISTHTADAGIPFLLTNRASRAAFPLSLQSSEMRGQHGEKMISAQYLCMPVEINDLDHENLDYFAYCAKHDFRLQRCASCKLFRYPPSTACPWCAELDSEWLSVEGRGTVHSYTEVHHAIQPAFKQYTPYLVLLV